MRAAPLPYKMKPMSAEMHEKVERSHAESLELTERNLYCPHCGFFIQTLFSDSAGHFRAKCQKCKAETIFNSAYFHRAKRRRSFSPQYPFTRPKH